jgi:phage terminase large subunit-like protein
VKQLATDPAMMSDLDLMAEIHAAMVSDRKSTRRWVCEIPDCDGTPHAGWRHHHARAKQRPPSWFWTTWVLLAGRAWGKTRSASETVKTWAKAPNQFIAVVAKNETLVREICFEHPKSGLLTVLDPDEVVSYSRSTGNVHLVMKNGTIIRGFGAEVPDNLRGWAFDKCWADEYAAWKRQTAQEAMDMIWFCLRESASPQVVISTTPKPLPHVVTLVNRHQEQLKRIEQQREAYEKGETEEPPAPGPRVVLVQGHTNENLTNLSDVAVQQLEDDYGGTRLGDQELGGILLEDVAGALWHRWMFEVDGFRVDRSDMPRLQRKVVAVDPATTTTETADETGFAVMGRTHWLDPRTNKDDRPHGYLLRSETKKMTPRQTMVHAAKLFHEEQADMVVLEANNGGDYLGTVLEMVDPTVPYRVVHATRDKRARATPFATLYEQERMHHVGPPRDFDHIETVMTTYVGAPEKDEKSPDDLDAAVWAAWDLFHDPATALGRPSMEEWAREAIGHPMSDDVDEDDRPEQPPASGRGRLPRRR